MKALVPITITDARLTSSTLPETDYGASAWNSGTSYALNAYAIYQHRVYQSLQGSNLNKVPDAASSSNWWNDLGPTNRWAMFDHSTGTVSTDTADIAMVITPNAVVNAVGLVGTVGTEVQVTVTDPTDGVVYDQTQQIESAPMASWYDYFFAESTFSRHIYFEGLPLYYAAPITVTIRGSSTRSLGALLVGTIHELGNAQYGVSSDFKDYSRKTTDTFGSYEFIQRGYADSNGYTLNVETADLPRIRALRPALRALPCMWICVDEDNLDIFTTYGWFKTWKVVLNWPTFAVCQLDIEGLA